MSILIYGSVPGYHPSELKGKKIGVYVGGSSSEAYDAWTTDADAQTGYGLLGCCRCMLANRVAFTFDFRGPSYTLDTACSSSMFALDAAFKSVQCGESDMALVAGVNLLLKPNTSVDFHRLSMLSQDGSCKVGSLIKFKNLLKVCDIFISCQQFRVGAFMPRFRQLVLSDGEISTVTQDTDSHYFSLSRFEFE